MKAEYYKDAQSVAEAIHNLRYGCKFESEEEAREERKRVRRKTLDFIVKWFDAACEEEKALLNVLIKFNFDVSGYGDELFKEMVDKRRRERNKRRAMELLVE